MTEIDSRTESLVPSWLSLADVADRLGIDVTRVRQLVRDKHLLAVRRGEQRTLHVPEAFLEGDRVLKGLPGTLTLLADNGFSAGEAMRWLFTEDDSLPGSPVAALRERRGTEVKRRAQALGF